jgi:RimJ/RimL family protein N-acetyltransferase/plasmid stabilization system protein ParE
MAFKIVYRKRFNKQLSALLVYLETEWNAVVADEFVDILLFKLATLANQPNLGIRSSKLQDARSILITKHNRLIYKLKGNTLIVLNLSDTRRNPKKTNISASTNCMILFSTTNFIVRQFTKEDAEAFYLLNSNPDVMHYIRLVKNRQACNEFLLENINLYQQGSVIGRYAVIKKATGNCMGTFSFLYMSTEDGYHIGYALLPNYWGKGFAQQLVRFGTSFFFKATNKQVLFAIADTDNIASQNVLLKNSFLLKETTSQNNKQVAIFYINKFSI